MSEIDDLLNRLEEDMEDREAIKKLGEYDYTYQVVLDKLQFIADNAGRRAKGDAKKALEKLADVPIKEPVTSEVDGREGTGFDEEVGDPSLRAGEYDTEDSLSKAEEDRLERAAEGKGLLVSLRENNMLTMDFYGKMKEKQVSKGKITVANTGERSRISGVDLLLENFDDLQAETKLEEVNKIGLVTPGLDNAWTYDYEFEQEYVPITVVQEYYDPETGLSPNFLGEVEKAFECKIQITNTNEEPIFNVKGVKNLNEIAQVDETLLETGEISVSGNAVEFTIEEIEAGATAEIILKMRAELPEHVPSYTAGDLNVAYDLAEHLTSGLDFKSVDGVSDVKQRVRRKQREEEPGFYDCEISFKNLSEFVYDLNRFTVFADTLENDVVVLDWDGSDAPEDEREIVPTEEKVFEFAFESPDMSPSFGNFINFSVQSQVIKETTTTITLPSEDLKFMALEINKSYLVGDQEVDEYELPSYVDTPVPTVLNIKGVGTYPLEGMTIADEIPEGFDEPDLGNVVVKRNGEDIDYFSTEVVTDDETGLRNLVIKLENLHEMDTGGFAENEELRVEYTATALRPEQSEEPIYAKSYAEGWAYEAPDAKVRAESAYESLKLIVVHRRSTVDISKQIISTDYEGKSAYSIELWAENSGTAIDDIKIYDLIPTGYALVEDSLRFIPDTGEAIDQADVNDGQVRGWEFKDTNPGDEITIEFTVTEEDVEVADPRKLSSVYKG